MRIAMIGHKVVPSRIGGVEIVVEEISSRLTLLGHDVTIYNRKRKGEKLKEYKGCKIEEVFTINKKSLDALIYSFFATLKAKRGKFDIIHFHAEGPCAFLNLLGKHKGTKIVVTIHGLDWQRGKWKGFGSKFLKRCEKKIVKYADDIIVLSKANQKYFKETYNRDTYVIPNGVNTPVLREPNIIKEKYGLIKNSYILFLARIVPEKGLHYLIEAWNKIDKKDIKLVIAGDSSHTNKYFKEIVNLVQNDKSIIMTGFVKGEELDELYSNCRLYVLPSDIEGMPISLLEALSYGAQCLVSNIPENVEVIENISDENNIFEKGNVEDLKNKLNILLNNTSGIMNKVNFSWDDVTEKTNVRYGERK